LLDLQPLDGPRVTHEFEFPARPDDSQDAGSSRNSIRPPFTEEIARRKVQAAEDASNTRDPDRVVLADSEDSEWRNQTEFLNGAMRSALFCAAKWAKELDYRLKKTAVRVPREPYCRVPRIRMARCERAMAPIVRQWVMGIRPGRIDAPADCEHQ
jgi:hypothetical protein